MPTYRAFTGTDFKMSVRPTRIRGVLHRAFRSYLNIPYFTGSNVNLILTIEPIRRVDYELNPHFTYDWRYYRCGADDIASLIEQGQDTVICNIGSRVTQKVTLPYISLAGQYVLELEVRYSGRDISNSSEERLFAERATLADFNAASKDTWTLRVVIGLIPIFGVVVGYLIGKFV